MHKIRRDILHSTGTLVDCQVTQMFLLSAAGPVTKILMATGPSRNGKVFWGTSYSQLPYLRHWTLLLPK